MCPIHFKEPQSNLSYWSPKFERNRKRDKIVNEFYKKNGWKILRFWEHDIKNNVQGCLEKINKEYWRL